MRVVFASVAKDAEEWEAASSETADLQKILKVSIVERWLSPAHQAEYILLDVSIWGTYHLTHRRRDGMHCGRLLIGVRHPPGLRFQTQGVGVRRHFFGL